MTTAAADRDIHKEHAQVRSVLEKELHALVERVGAQVPTEEEMDRLEKLARLDSLLPPIPPAKRSRWRVNGGRTVLVLVCAVTLGALVVMRVNRTRVEFDIRASAATLSFDDDVADIIRGTLRHLRLQLPIQPERSGYLGVVDRTSAKLDRIFERTYKGREQLVPNQWGQEVSLVRANVAGKCNLKQDDREITLAEPLDGHTDGESLSARAVRLTSLSIPNNGGRLHVGVEYRVGQSGITIASSGDDGMQADFTRAVVAQVIDDETPKHAAPKHEYRLQRVSVQGDDLELGLYPLNTGRPLTILRDKRVSHVSFTYSGDQGRSSIEKATLAIADRDSSVVELLPGDSLHFEGTTTVRQLTYADGTFTVTMSAEVTELEADGRDLMPSRFEWLRARWPANFYASLVALTGIVLAGLRLVQEK
jgi:hypothetical protein